MWRLCTSLLSGVIAASACVRQIAEGPKEPVLFTPDGIPRSSLLGLVADTVRQVEKAQPYYQDELGCAYRFTETSDSLEIWVEYYTGGRGRIQTVSITYESPVFRVLTKRYQSWRMFLREAYGTSQGHLGHEVWKTPEGVRVRLLLSPDRNYLQVTFSAERQARTP